MQLRLYTPRGHTNFYGAVACADCLKKKRLLFRKEIRNSSADTYCCDKVPIACKPKIPRRIVNDFNQTRYASANDNRSNENQLSKLKECEAQSFVQLRKENSVAPGDELSNDSKGWLVQSVHSIYPADFLKKMPVQINFGKNKLKQPDKLSLLCSPPRWLVLRLHVCETQKCFKNVSNGFLV